jgi:hypothetical protein
MILKLSICGLLIVLVAVLTLSYYFNQEGFDSPAPRNQAVAPAVALAPLSAPAVAPAVAPAALRGASGSDLSKGSSLVPASGSGPAPFSSLATPALGANLAANAAAPRRNDIQPQNTLSDTAQTAMSAQGKSDFLKSIQKTGCAVSAEEHNIIGGLGDSIAQIAATSCPVPQEFIGTKDTFGESGKPAELLVKYGLDAANIAAAAERAMGRKK